MKRFFLPIAVCALLFSALPALATPTVGTILAGSPFAWGENVGWINFNPSRGGLVITDADIRGYAWSRQYGWINFSPSGIPISNNGEGTLSGSAWVAGRGWLNMSGVTIDGDGRFHGIAGQAGTAVGRVSFDCDSCQVFTDWRPRSIRQSGTPSGGGGGGGTPVPAPTSTVPPSSTMPPDTEPAPTGTVPPDTSPTPEGPASQPPVNPVPQDKPSSPAPGSEPTKNDEKLVESRNLPLSLKPNESGTLIRELGDGTEVQIDVFGGVSENPFMIDIKPLPVDLHGYDPLVESGSDFFFDVTAMDEKGKAFTDFRVPVKLTLPFSDAREESGQYGVYRLNEVSGEWERVEGVIFSEDNAVFYASSAGRYAILKAPGLPERISPTPIIDPKRSILPLAVAGIVLVVAAYIAFAFKKRT